MMTAGVFVITDAIETTTNAGVVVIIDCDKIMSLFGGVIVVKIAVNSNNTTNNDSHIIVIVLFDIAYVSLYSAYTLFLISFVFSLDSFVILVIRGANKISIIKTVYFITVI
mmetsp:Transcript_5040/g.4961  ORF Transcript_5040/g.4961 Transcript_5040/m.4961 type:complete len:111 (+) Transcript_5040:399-731(+)